MTEHNRYGYVDAGHADGPWKDARAGHESGAGQPL